MVVRRESRAAVERRLVRPHHGLAGPVLAVPVGRAQRLLVLPVQDARLRRQAGHVPGWRGRDRHRVGRRPRRVPRPPPDVQEPKVDGVAGEAAQDRAGAVGGRGEAEVDRAAGRDPPVEGGGAAAVHPEA